MINRLELLKALRDEINYNVELELHPNSKGKRVIFAVQVYKGTAHTLGFLKSGNIQKIIEHYSVIEHYKNALDSYRWSIDYLSESGNKGPSEEMMTVLENFHSESSLQKSTIKETGKDVLPIINKEIKAIKSKRFYMINNDESSQDSNKEIIGTDNSQS